MEFSWRKNMKKRIIGLLAGAMVSFATYGQGTVIFNTFIPGSVDARVSVPEGGFGLREGSMAQLYLITGSGASTVYTPLLPATTFRTSSAAAAHYVVPPSESVVVPGVPAGAQATLVMRAWIGGATYESSQFKGQTAPVTITLGGTPPGGGAPIPDALLVGLQGFSIPEPSVMAVTILGAVVLLMRRRK